MVPEPDKALEVTELVDAKVVPDSVAAMAVSKQVAVEAVAALRAELETRTGPATPAASLDPGLKVKAELGPEPG